MSNDRKVHTYFKYRLYFKDGTTKDDYFWDSAAVADYVAEWNDTFGAAREGREITDFEPMHTVREVPYNETDS